MLKRYTNSRHLPTNLQQCRLSTCTMANFARCSHSNGGIDQSDIVLSKRDTIDVYIDTIFMLIDQLVAVQEGTKALSKRHQTAISTLFNLPYLLHPRPRRNKKYLGRYSTKRSVMHEESKICAHLPMPLVAYEDCQSAIQHCRKFVGKC